MCNVHYYKGAVEEKMNRRFNIISVVTYRIEFVLKAVFELVLLQMNKSMIQIGLGQSKNELEEGCMSFNILLLAIL